MKESTKPIAKILVIEDNDALRRELVQTLEVIESSVVTSTGSFEVAKRMLRNAECDVCVTDMRIDKPSSPGWDNAALLLQMLKSNDIPIRTIATSQWRDDLEAVKEQGLADFTFTKDEDPHGHETRKVVERFVKETLELKNSLCDLLIDLYLASSSKDLATAATHYRKSKDRLIEIARVSGKSRELRKSVWAIQQFVTHLSPINAPDLQLKQLSKEAYKILIEFLTRISEPSFKYAHDGVDFIARLESLGYQVTPRFKLEL